MKHTKIALLSAVAAIALSSAAVAQDTRGSTYFSISGGGNMPENSNVDYSSPAIAGGAPLSATTNFDTGFILSGALGYRWASGMRTELEANYRKASVDSIAGADASGKQRVLGLMGNVLFDIGELGTFRPYVGGGVGVGWNKWSNVASGGPSATFPAGSGNYGDRDAALQWQGIAGLSMPFGESTDGFVEYRYIGLEQTAFVGAPAGATATGHKDRSHNALVGVRMHF